MQVLLLQQPHQWALLITACQQWQSSVPAWELHRTRTAKFWQCLLQSNEWTGKESFSGHSLHQLSPIPNPYEEAMMIIGKTLASFDDDQLIPAYGFGDGESSSSSSSMAMQQYSNPEALWIIFNQTASLLLHHEHSWSLQLAFKSRCCNTQLHSITHTCSADHSKGTDSAHVNL
jgi:hypothetical protein